MADLKHLTFNIDCLAPNVLLASPMAFPGPSTRIRSSL
jgi:hypothetical protein